MKKSGYIFLDHTADIQVKSWGNTLEEAFTQTAYGLMATITPDLNKVRSHIEKKIVIESEDKEALLFDFLSEFLYIFDVEGLVFNKIEVISITELKNQYKLEAILNGEKFNRHIHEIGTEVKAITYSFMEIKEEGEHVEIKTIFDI